MLVKDIIDHFNVEIELPESLLNLDLPINKMFDKYEIKKDGIFRYEFHWFSYEDSPIILTIPTDIERDNEKSIELYGLSGDEMSGKSYYEDGRTKCALRLTDEKAEKIFNIHYSYSLIDE